MATRFPAPVQSRPLSVLGSHRVKILAPIDRPPRKAGNPGGGAEPHPRPDPPDDGAGSLRAPPSVPAAPTTLLHGGQLCPPRLGHDDRVLPAAGPAATTTTCAAPSGGGDWMGVATAVPSRSRPLADAGIPAAPFAGAAASTAARGEAPGVMIVGGSSYAANAIPAAGLPPTRTENPRTPRRRLHTQHGQAPGRSAAWPGAARQPAPQGRPGAGGGGVVPGCLPLQPAQDGSTRVTVSGCDASTPEPAAAPGSSSNSSSPKAVSRHASKRSLWSPRVLDSAWGLFLAGSRADLRKASRLRFAEDAAPVGAATGHPSAQTFLEWKLTKQVSAVSQAEARERDAVTCIAADVYHVYFAPLSERMAFASVEDGRRGLLRASEADARTRVCARCRQGERALAQLQCLRLLVRAQGFRVLSAHRKTRQAARQRRAEREDAVRHLLRRVASRYYGRLAGFRSFRRRLAPLAGALAAAEAAARAAAAAAEQAGFAKLNDAARAVAVRVWIADWRVKDLPDEEARHRHART
ncbi:hypothetical protein DIPPA_06040, partial [Diplonema papillatum]